MPCNKIFFCQACYKNCAHVRGYTAPEYAIHGQLSEKADTYSYGVVVLEIISGQKSSELREHADGEFLLRRVCNFKELNNKKY